MTQTIPRMIAPQKSTIRAIINTIQPAPTSPCMPQRSASGIACVRFISSPPGTSSLRRADSRPQLVERVLCTLGGQLARPLLDITAHPHGRRDLGGVEPDPEGGRDL